MEWSLGFVFNSVMLGAGLAMDAFSVSLANGMNCPCMKRSRALLIAGVFAFFQCAMPLIGWVCIHTVVQYFRAFEKFIPWIALVLLSFIGGNMLLEGLRHRGGCDSEDAGLGFGALMVQGVATSIDALSVGFTIAEYGALMAVAAALIIAVVTFVICTAGVLIGQKFGTRLSNKAQILGGVILIVIGIEIFVTGII